MPRFELLKVQLPGLIVRIVEDCRGPWLSNLLLEISESLTAADGGMMKPGFFEAHYSEPTVLDALVLGPK